MLQKLLLSLAILPFLFSCKKNTTTDINAKTGIPQNDQFFEYVISKGQHYANFNAFQSVQYRELKFVVRFDNTAQYTTIETGNQEDINKLYGFSDNNAEHHQFSARFGWNWARGALRLYAYVYNNGERNSREIMALQPGQEYSCSIKVAGNKYIFSVRTARVEMHRASTTELATGYKLYPYFGGDEAAPHDVHILIKEVNS